MNIRKQFHYVPKKEQYESVTGESKTIPDKSMSIKEMFRRISQGIPVGSYVKTDAQQYFDEDNGVPNLKELDLTQIQELKDQYTEVIERSEKNIQAIKQAQYEREIVDRHERTRTQAMGAGVQDPEPKGGV